MRAIAPWVAVALPLIAWVLPPALLAVSLAGIGGDGLSFWAASATGASLSFWVVVDLHHRVPVTYALTFPFGALATALVFTRSALRGGRIRWKGRSYSAPLPPAHDGEAARPLRLPDRESPARPGPAPGRRGEG